MWWNPQSRILSSSSCPQPPCENVPRSPPRSDRSANNNWGQCKWIIGKTFHMHYGFFLSRRHRGGCYGSESFRLGSACPLIRFIARQRSVVSSSSITILNKSATHSFRCKMLPGKQKILLVQCWASVYDAGPTLNRQCLTDSWCRVVPSPITSSRLIYDAGLTLNRRCLTD